MKYNSKSLGRRELLRMTAMVGSVIMTLGFTAAANAEPVELRYFYRAPWPSSEIYANWMIDEWNKANGDRIHVTGASVDGETYKTKQAIELASSNPPDIFYSWEGGRAAEIIANGFAADLSSYYESMDGPTPWCPPVSALRHSTASNTSSRLRSVHLSYGIAPISMNSLA